MADQINDIAKQAGANIRRPQPPVTLARAVDPRSVEGIITDRHASHGDYAHTAKMAQGLKRVLWSIEGWGNLTDTQRESMEMICTKMARIMAGNPNVKDHWDDIAGYAKLCADRVVEG